MTSFNFDEWAELYKNDPAEFERRRIELLEKTIQQAPMAVRSKLRVTQMECDAIHNTMTPLDATKEISRLMINKMFDLQDAFLDLGIACKEFDEQNKM